MSEKTIGDLIRDIGNRLWNLKLRSLGIFAVIIVGIVILGAGFNAYRNSVRQYVAHLDWVSDYCFRQYPLTYGKPQDFDVVGYNKCVEENRELKVPPFYLQARKWGMHR